MDNDNANPKQQLLAKLKSSTNILVTVSANPSVDQLASCIGLTLWLNKINKHATAVFSGKVPSTLEFLQPEDTLEKTTDSLRDFIISLDKSKADKLRYKVEDKVVKIFITPYRTNISDADLEFSQGDFNVDMVVAIGVTKQEDLDAAITAHGRILHDATVTTINVRDSQLGSINWTDTQASSLSELAVDIGNELDKTKLDGQIATALLTGIVAETARFSNDKTTPQTMSISAQLMSAGANQQLVASKLEEKPTKHVADDRTDNRSKPPKNDDGTLEIAHRATADEPPAAGIEDNMPKLVTDPPAMGGTLTANSRPDDDEPDRSSDPFSLPAVEPDQPLLDHSTLQPAPANWMPPASPAEPVEDDETLDEIEKEVHSPHLESTETPESIDPAQVDSARDEVMKALNSAPDTSPPPPVQALNAQPIDLNPPAPAEPAPSTTFDPAAFGVINDPEVPDPAKPPAPAPTAEEMSGPIDQPYTMPLPTNLTPPPANPVPPTSSNVTDPTAPPPVPPPMTNLPPVQ